jgi:sulfotransferase family protein
MAPVPEGWRVGPPAYVGIGPGSTGTSWWHQMLLEHPQVTENRLRAKELNYFMYFSFRSPSAEELETYRVAFAAPPGAICGEWSPGYLGNPFALEHVAAAAPEAKVLAILRDPVERVPSAMNRLLARGRNQRAAMSGAVSSALPVSALRRAQALFGPARLLVLQYERCRAQPAAEIARTYRFLGIDDTYEPPSLRDRVNSLVHQVGPLRPDERARLVDYFAADVVELATLFPEVDVSLWPDFAIESS